MKIFARRKNNRTLKGDKLPTSEIVSECECYMSPTVLEKELVPMSIPTNNNSFNVHAWKASKTASFEAERKKAKALMEWQRHRII